MKASQQARVVQPTAARSLVSRKRYVAALLTGLALIIWKTRSPRCKPEPISALEDWIDQEREVALDGVLQNIGPPVGVAEGIIVASPSKGDRENEPDYFYTWTRDSALTISSLLPSFLPSPYLHPWIPQSSGRITNHSSPDIRYEALLRQYITAQSTIQTIQSLSGDLYTGGLNEPKYNTNQTSFDGPWGRPQRDGPALRALSIIPYAHYLLDRGHELDVEYVKEVLYDPGCVRKEGRMIWRRWRVDGRRVDLIYGKKNGHHLWNRMASIRALQAGSILAERLNDTGAATYYAHVAKEIEESVPDFWKFTDEESGKGYWQATIFDEHLVHRPERMGLDCALPLTVIHSGGRGENGAAGMMKHAQRQEGKVGQFDAGESGVLASLREFVTSFRNVYAINGDKEWTEGWAVGRYKEDVYDGVGSSKGNPWFICTLAVANTFYLAQKSIARDKDVPLNNLTIPFWTDLFPDQQSFTVDEAVERLGKVGDGFMDVARRYSVDGRMSEQIDRDNGKMRGAGDLTWSYASFFEAVKARDDARQTIPRRSSISNDGFWARIGLMLDRLRLW